MGPRAIENRLRKIEELELQKKALEKQITELKEEIKADMSEKGVEEVHTKSFVVCWKEVFSNSFNSKKLKKDHGDLYESYRELGSCMRFTYSRA